MQDRSTPRPVPAGTPLRELTWLFTGIVLTPWSRIHAAYVAFVVVGQLLIFAGWLARWQWIRNAWFRGIHVLTIFIVAA